MSLSHFRLLPQCRRPLLLPLTSPSLNIVGCCYREGSNATSSLSQRRCYPSNIAPIIFWILCFCELQDEIIELGGRLTGDHECSNFFDSLDDLISASKEKLDSVKKALTSSVRGTLALKRLLDDVPTQTELIQSVVMMPSFPFFLGADCSYFFSAIIALLSHIS
ncbi:coiled-coil domain-containing protein 93 isoform X4 [Cucumis melo var. makuwa]|uniref:Coiled-coil domain-containing protein 93 isoform X4 n=1 Tax=Cucumis melo var. makuwa TaxID=1194695 RepID=A0A5D3D4S7_CUCMM|nr:coiled-coil domain-containing protein 93 isoform X4 [Cucumis melo var. makuwa]TYK18541.1 coiled-coil domain-containing protein 93 isoform X4 [Cucumis melo var. makuwa]